LRPIFAEVNLEISIDARLLPHLAHSRLQKYPVPGNTGSTTSKALGPKYEAGERVFGAVMHLALVPNIFRKQRDPFATVRTEGNACREFDLRHSQREGWEKLSNTGEVLLTKFLAREAHKFQQILAVEAAFQIGVSNVATPIVGTLDLLALLQGKRTLVEFKTAVNDWGEHDVLLSD
jgi:hypothetical protein